MSGEPRYVTADLGQIGCLDCGALVFEQSAHTRFHSILSGGAWALAVLQTAHIGAGVHDRYEVRERINSKHFDSWSADALAEVIADLPPEETSVTRLAAGGRAQQPGGAT